MSHNNSLTCERFCLVYFPGADMLTLHRRDLQFVWHRDGYDPCALVTHRRVNEDKLFLGHSLPGKHVHSCIAENSSMHND